MADETKPTTADTTPWYQSAFAKYAIGIALGVALSLLSRIGITPQPLPTLPFAQPQPIVLVIGAGQGQAQPVAVPLTAAGK